jgi:hypothetical protein
MRWEKDDVSSLEMAFMCSSPIQGVGKIADSVCGRGLHPEVDA